MPLKKENQSKQNMHIAWLYGLVSLFNGISTFVGYLLPMPCL